MDSAGKKNDAWKLRIVRNEEAEIRAAADEAPKAGAPKSALGKELTRFADELDDYIQSLLKY